MSNIGLIPRIQLSKAAGKITVIAVPLFVSVVGCRSKLDVKTSSGDQPPQSEGPQEALKEGLQTPTPNPSGTVSMPEKSIEQAAGTAALNRQYFFAKDTIEVEIKRELVEGAQHLDVFNVTKVSDPLNEQGLSLVKNYEIPDNLDIPWPPGKGFAIENKGTIRLRIFQSHVEVRKKLFTGRNRLMLIARDGDFHKVAEIELSIVSNKFFELSNLIFANGKPYGEAVTPKGTYVLESWLDLVDKVAVKDSTGKFALVVGSMNQMHSFQHP